jgi:splicing factor 3B subunit 3
VLSFTDATLVLGIGESVEEVQDSGFLLTVPTLSATRLGENSLLQIYPGGIRHIRGDGRVNEWKAPGASTIVKCAANATQVAIALSNSELVYFELDRAEQLNEFTERLELTSKVTAMGLSPIPEGERNARFLALGMSDNTVRMLSLDPSTCLQPLPLQMLPEVITSLCMTEQAGVRGEPSTIQLNVGLENGLLLRTTVDPVTGDQSDTRTRYLGARAVKLHPIYMHGHAGVLALTTRPWLSYSHFGAPRVTPLSYETLEFAHSFHSEQCPEGMVAVTGNTLRILSIDKLGTVLHHVSVPLQYTGRRLAVDEEVRRSGVGATKGRSTMALLSSDTYACLLHTSPPSLPFPS